MRKWIVFVFFVVGMVSVGHAQAMPEEVRVFLDCYNIMDSTARFGPLNAKKARYFDDSIQIKDLRLRALEMYKFKHVFLDAYPDTVPFSELIEPSGYWRVLVMAHNKPLYEFYLDNSKGVPELAGMGGPIPSDGSHIWGPLLEDYVESTRFNPILFSRSGIPFLPGESFFYFKHKGPRKIRYLGRGRFKEPSLENIDDSKLLMEHWKQKGLNEVGVSGEEYRRRQEAVEKNGGRR